MAEQSNQGNNSPGSGSSGSVSYSAATSITSAGTYSNQTYTSTTNAENAVLVSLSSGTVNLVNPTVNKSGGPTNAGDNYNFYGINSGVMAMGGGTVSITGGTITTTGVGANGVFSYGGNGGTNGAAGDGTTVYISDATIKTSASGSGGIMTTGGGKTIAKNLTINTTGQSSAPIRTDRGGGTVSVVGGSYTSSGLGSPAVYSTADITVESATLTSNLSEGVCIEGANSVALTNCTLTASNTQTNGNAQFLDAVILYQSQSGDAASGTSTFNMTGGVINNTSGHVFHVTNTSAVISLNGVTINDSGSGVLLSVCDDGWSGASNIATLNASGQTLDGDILVADDSTLTLNITDNSTFTGKVSGEITNNAGTTVSTSVGTVNISLDSSSKWYLEEDTYISSFSGTAANVITGNYKLYANNVEVSGTTESDDTDTTPSALNLVNTTSNTLITGTAYGDTISNSGTRVTIQALAGNDSISNTGANTSIVGGDNNDTIYNNASNTTVLGGAGTDSIYNDNGTTVLIDGGADADTITNWSQGVTILGGAGNDFINNRNAANGFANGGDGNDTIYNAGANSSVSGGSGNDSITHSGANSTVNGEAGSDTISNQGANNLVTGGAGNDSIYNYGGNVTITGGAGNDTITNNNSDSVLFNYASGDGDDYITGFNATSTLSISGGTYSTTASGNNLIVTVGDGNITLNGAATLSTVNIIGTLSGGTDTTSGALNITNTTSNTLINGTAYDDTINNTGTRVTIQGLAGNDYITNDVDSTLTAASLGNSINAGDGNDTIYNHHSYNPTLLGGAGDDSIVVSRGHLTYVDGGAGNDTIIGQLTGTHDNDWEMGGYATLIGGDGNDYIAPGYANNSSIDGGAGDDTISMMGASSTITGGTGDDRISLGTADSVNVVINYADGDGNDVIIGFTENDTLSISGNIYSTTASGNDVIVTAGDGNITLNGAASLDAINIAGPSQDNLETATSLVGAMLYRTDKGYPYIAELAFNPTVYHGDEPTNYAAKETWTIKSANAIESTDGLELQGIHYTPENSNDKWVVIVHGYGHNHKHMYPFAGFFLDNGYNVLMVDQRAAGDSEGTWLTMGTAESADIALWTQEIARHNSNAKITLFGVSMGAATAMLAAARDDITNVTSLVEDCGYSNVVDIINLFNNVLLHQEQETVDLMMPVSESLTGYNLKDAAPINSISAAKMPTLFITGSEDSVVAGSMLPALYNASGAEVKEQFIVEGATHGMAGMYDPVGYSNTTFRFLAEANGEGWDTENAVDDISLRGTKYNDTIANSGDNVTINAQGGDDLITNSGENLLLNYTSGDGNDLITGFGENSSLSISGGTYSTVASGNDLILGVDSSSITLSGAATLDNPNIIGTYSTTAGGVNIVNTTNGTLITGTAYADTITNTGMRVTIEALEGDDYIANVVDSSVTTASLGNSINAGAGNDTIYNYHTYNPTLLGGAGDDSIVVANGHRTFIDGGDGNDTIVGENTSLESDDWTMGGYATIDGGAGDDYIAPGYANNSSINGGEGDDTIITNGKNATVDGGDGNNLIQLTTTEGGQTGQVIVFNGNTTIENFGLGFGEGTDTIYIPGAPAGVDFRSSGLTFYGDSDTLTLIDVTTTAKVNLYHERRKMLNKGVFIADNDWYSVTDDDLSVKSGEEVYFVGPSSSPNHGVDFSDISQDLNVTIDTEYEIPNNSIWINGVYSIRGGAGLTTLIGSAQNDTILTGTGATTIEANAGDDFIDVTDSATDLINYTSGDGNDYIVGFDEYSTLKISGAAYSSMTSGDNLILTVNGEKISVIGAAGLSAPNIIGTTIEDSLPAGATYIGGGSATLSSDDKLIYVGSEGATLEGYTIDKAFIVDANTAGDLVDSINDHDFTLDEGKFYAKGQQPVVLEDVDTSKGTFVKFQAADGKRSLFGWSPLAGGVVDGSDIEQKQILFGGAPNGSSTITGGKRNDSIYADADDLVNLSEGYDKIYRTHDKSGGLTIDMGDGSTATRTEVVEGIDLDNDKIKIDSDNNITARMLNGKLALEKGDTRLSFAELGSFADADGLKVDTGNEIYTLRSDYDSGISDADFFWQDSNDRYYKAGTDFYIVDNSDNRDYHIGTTAGNMTIDGFEFGTDGDAICLNSVEGLGAGGNDVYVESPDGKRVIISGGAGQVIKVKDPDNNIYVAELGKQLTYNDDVEYYGDLQGETGCAISVGADYGGSEVAVYLNGARETNGRSKTYMGVNKIDASAFTGEASLVGAELDDYIIASQGDTSLWGGNGGNDILVGTGYGNTFFYTKGDGNDEIRNAADGDVINLGDITLDDISSALIMNSGVKLDFKDGGNLTLSNAADVTFKLADGSSYGADYDSHSWQSK